MWHRGEYFAMSYCINHGGWQIELSTDRLASRAKRTSKAIKTVSLPWTLGDEDAPSVRKEALVNSIAR